MHWMIKTSVVEVWQPLFIFYFFVIQIYKAKIGSNIINNVILLLLPTDRDCIELLARFATFRMQETYVPQRERELRTPPPPSPSLTVHPDFTCHRQTANSKTCGHDMLALNPWANCSHDPATNMRTFTTDCTRKTSLLPDLLLLKSLC